MRYRAYLPGLITALQTHRERACLHSDTPRNQYRRPRSSRKESDVTLRSAMRGTSADLAVAVLAPGGQFVLWRGNRLAAVGTLAREIGDCAGQLTHRAADRDPEHALTALQQVDDLLGGRAL